MPAAKKPASKGGFVRAKESFSGQRGKENTVVVVHKGDFLPDDAEAVKLFPEFFETIEEFVRPQVEQATAAPGEKR